MAFYWKVSSQSGYDFLKFFIDGSPWTSISGNVDWEQYSKSIGSGSHILRWEYIKNNFGVGGSDCGWLDKVEFIPDY